MGSYQSKPSLDTEKAILERIRSMRLDDNKDGNGDDYVCITHGNDNNAADERDEKAMHIAKSRQPEGISVSLMEEWQDTLLSDAKNRLALAALSKNDPREILASRAVKMADAQVFNVQIPFEGGPITNQRSSGRCWLFASTNVFRVALMQKYKVDAFELSQAYLFFWDKLEKSNWFLEQVLATADMDLDSRLVQTLLGEPVSDGGQWDMVYNLVDKYGLVPQALYPDSYSATASAVLNSIVIAKLREGALVLRRLAGKPSPSPSPSPSSTTASSVSVSGAKAKILREIHAILTLTLGPPPAADAEFSWTFSDRTGKARTVRSTPRAFAADISSSAECRISASTIAGMVSVVHDPRHAPLTLLTVDRLGNVVGGRGVTYVNADMATLKAACVATLKAGVPIFFGSDVGKFSDRVSGVMDTALVDYELGFNVALLAGSKKNSGGMDKAARLRTGESRMTHAMVLTAVHVDEDTGRSVRWRVQNSWGADVGDKGWFVMSDVWMDEFVYQAVIDPRFLTKEVRDVLRQEPVVLPLWDPMGSLA